MYHAFTTLLGNFRKNLYSLLPLLLLKQNTYICTPYEEIENLKKRI